MYTYVRIKLRQMKEFQQWMEMQINLVKQVKEELGGKPEISQQRKKIEITSGRIPYRPLPDNLHFMPL